ncbi:MAG: T9SS type A sorting domain-containing protein [Bacteroidota bacterium]
MKKLILVSFFALMFSISFAQTAVNFNCNDCAGANHDLFTELDEGKVIVICWVMPCSACVGPSLTTSNVVRSFATTHPDKVIMYLVDDYANTNCNSINSWANSNGILPAAMFSNSSIKMEDYGSTGMPKVVVVGDVNHAVFYNANNSVNASALQSAINAAIDATITGVPEDFGKSSSVEIFPNPSNISASLVFSLEKPSVVKVEIHDQLGREVSEMYFPSLPQGENKIDISTAGLSNGVYFIKLTEGTRSRMIKIAVAH